MAMSDHLRDGTGLMPVAPEMFLAPDLPDETAEDDDQQPDQGRGAPSRVPFTADGA